MASNFALKLTACPVTALATGSAGLGTAPGCARAAPGHPAAYRWRYAHKVTMGSWPNRLFRSLPLALCAQSDDGFLAESFV
jgi:hypothetical protein